MIWSWLADMASGLATWLVGVLPAPDTPGWLASLPSKLSGLSSGFAFLANWAPVDAMRVVLVAWVSAYLIAGAIYLVRLVLSLFTGGGGSVA